MRILATLNAGDLRISLVERGPVGELPLPLANFVTRGDDLLVEENRPDVMGEASWRPVRLDREGRTGWGTSLRAILIRLLDEAAEVPRPCLPEAP